MKENGRESGFYEEPKEALYVGLDEEVDFCEVEEANRLGLYESYRQSAVAVTYVQWLEDRILAGSAA